MAPGIAWFGRGSSRPREKSSKDKRDKEQSKEIEKGIKDDKKRKDREIKVLLLGSLP